MKRCSALMMTSAELLGLVMKIISGAQTGVDRAALDAALELGVPIGGYCPKGRRAEDGTIPDKYPLIETGSRDYRERTERNVHESDATLILVSDKRLTGGTLLTHKLAVEHRRPVRVVVLDDWEFKPESMIDRRAWFESWVRARSVKVLNVAGPRESKCPGIYDLAKAFLLEVLNGVGK